MTRRKKIIILLAVVLVVAVTFLFSLGGRVPSNSVLVLDLGGVIEDQPSPDPLARLTGPKVTVTHDVLTAIDEAARDSRIAGLVVKITPSNAGWAKLEEIRARLEEFRQSNKPSICFLASDILTNREYFLATGCEKVWLAPTAAVGTTGMMASATFLRGTLDKLGVEANMFGTGEFKTYRNQFTERAFTPAHRAMTVSLVDSLYQRYVQQVAKSRKLQPAEFDRMLRAGPYLPSEAMEKRLVDRLASWDQVQEHFREHSGAWKPIELERYVSLRFDYGPHTIAVVNATGAIYPGKSRHDSWEGFIMGADSVAADLRRAREDESVKAIVLRVDSPGGSVVASEIIRREVLRAKEAGKPVVVSMSDTAASGGYWISMSANRIVAEPTTITGSIGVVFGKLNISGLYKLLGLSTDYYANSPNATLLYEQQNFSPEQRKVIERFMYDNYEQFKQGVAEGRNLDLKKVEEIARGRVWTGAQAKEHGLIDEFGGMDRALALARELAGIGADERVRILRLPAERSLFDVLFSALPGTVRSESAIERLQRAARTPPWLEARMPFELEVR
jgi:protease-4